MPGKSRHGKGKHPHYSKKYKIRQRQIRPGLPQQADTGIPTQAAANIPQPTALVSSRPGPKSAPSVTTNVIQYPIINELKKIGILAGIIIIVLIILYIILS